MNSSISHFSWIGGVLACFLAIETAIAWLAPRPDAMRNSFLEYSFAHPEMVQRAFVAEKMLKFDDAKPDVLQVGDSSGLHAVQSPIVESYLGGRSFLNLSVASNLGFWGYHALADRIMERSGSVKVLVLYFTTGGGVPRKALLDARDLMANDLYREFASPFHRLFQVPSLGVRREVSDTFYYINGYLSQRDRPLINNTGYFMLRDIIESSGGWVRETDIPDDHIDGLFQMIRRNTPSLAAYSDAGLVRHYRDTVGKTEISSTFDWTSLSRRTYMEIVLDKYLALARKHGAKLVVAANPVPASFQTEAFKVGFDTDGIERSMRDYASRHPDVSVLGIDYWPDDKFSVFSHVGTPYSVESSHRMGQFLAGLMPSVAGPTSKAEKYEAPASVVLDMGANPSVYGFADAEQAQGSTVRFRRIRAGRDEALAYARVRPGAAQELRIAVLNKADDPVLKNISVGVFGVRAERLPDIDTGEMRLVRFALPMSETKRFDGWIELALSTRGEIAWQSNELRSSATGPQLMVARMVLAAANESAGR